MIRHEVVCGRDGIPNADADPLTDKYLLLEEHNQMCCNFLNAKGFDGDQLREKAPVVASAAIAGPVTAPLSRERQNLITKAKSAGQMFHATGGQHLNSDDVFLAQAREEQCRQIKNLEEKKAGQVSEFNRECLAKEILKKFNGESNFFPLLPNCEMKILLQWKLGSSTIKGKKASLVQQWNKLLEPAPAIPWSTENEQSLQDLKSKTIRIEDSKLGEERKRIGRATVAAIQHMSPATIEAIEKSIHNRYTKEAKDNAQSR